MAKVYVITGPSGVGKGTLIAGLLERVPDLELSVSATTRSPRAGERDGVQYHFMTDAEFQSHVDRGDFLEYADYSGRRYGTLRSEVQKRLERGISVVLEIEVQGAGQIRRAMPEAVQIFIAPPSFGELEKRLVARGTDSSDQIARRLEVAQGELQERDSFTHTVTNDELSTALTELTEVVDRYR